MDVLMPPRANANLLSALLLLALASCVSVDKVRFESVEIGMSKDQVREILGQPSSTYQRETDASGRMLRLERWQYGDTLSTLATGAVFSRHPDRHVWVVYFDADDQVLDVSEPDWSPEPPSTVPSAIPPRNQ
jgi:hypothetical protein